jgi:hypothetical protein
MAKVVVISVVPVLDGARRASKPLPLLASNSECEIGNCASKKAFAIQLHGVERWPSDRLMPKNIATIIVPTPSTKHAWHVVP